MLTEYSDMPPVVEKVTKVVKVATKLFKDIKNDVMRFYEVHETLCDEDGKGTKSIPSFALLSVNTKKIVVVR